MSRRCSAPALDRVRALAGDLDGADGVVLTGAEVARMIRAAVDGRELPGLDVRSPDLTPLQVLLAAVDNCLRMGSHMNGGNYAMELLCDRLGVSRDQLVFDPGWVRPEGDHWPFMAGRTSGSVR